MRYPICRSTTLGGIFLLGALAVPFSGALAQDRDQGDEVLEEITVTGSAFKRVDLDSALPIQVLTADKLDRQGITNAGDMVEAVPAMQGFITESDSVGGGGGGIRTANLRAIGDQYTLSLLNGRRMAPADSGSSIDLSNIPLAAVEQVHILTDGASALYGSDAIAGVVNFILKDSVDETTINIRSDMPETSGGEHWNVDIFTGFGDLDEDGYSLVAAFSHEDQEQLKASDRSFSKTGFVFFNHGGQELYFQNSSPNAIPGNATIYSNDNYTGSIRVFNPNAAANGGVCANQTTPDGETCRFDYTSTLEVLPESKRDSLSLNGKVRFNDNLNGFATVLASQYELTARIAPYPTGSVPMWSSASGDPVPQLLLDEVWPHLTAAELAAVNSVTGQWRALPAGNRTTKYAIDSMNFTFGLEGNTSNIDYKAALTYATTEIDQDFPTGWLISEPFVDAVSSAAFNIFAAQEDFTEADQAALAPTVYHGDWDVVENTMTALDAQASMPVFEMAGGDLMLAAGFDYRTTNYDRTISEVNANEELLFLSPDTPYELDRSQYGLFVEALIPFAETFEGTVSVRFDDISAVEDKLSGGDIDSGDSDTTYKVSGLWTVNDAVALRASYGTGFKGPSMREIGEPLSDFGVTSGTYECPLMPGDPLFQFCKPQEGKQGHS